MTYDEFEAAHDDIVTAYNEGDITETQFEDDMEALASQWEDEGEE